MNLIAVWGSSGSGKTTVSLALGAELARERSVLILSTDSRAPALPVYLPKDEVKLNRNNSLSGLLEHPEMISVDSLRGRLHLHSQSRQLAFAGYVSGELPGITSNAVLHDSAMTLLQMLPQVGFDTAIVDCDANAAYDGLTLAALEAAQTVLRISTPTIKDFEYQKAQLAWMQSNAALKVDRHIKVANHSMPFSPLEDAKTLFGGFDFILPYADQVAERMMAGELLRDFYQRSAIDFSRQIKRLSERAKGEDTAA